VAVIPHWTVLHFQNSGDAVESRAARHALRKILEFTDLPPLGFFSPDIDTIVSEYPLWNASWTPLSISTQVLNGANVWTLETNTVDGVVTLAIYLTDTAVTMTNGTTTINLDNNAIHHTFKISKYPYKGTGTELALKVHFESRTAIQDFASGTPNQNSTQLVGITGDTIQPIAVWDNTVTLSGGNNCPATAPILRDIYRSVESPNDIDRGLPSLPIETVITLQEHITYFSFNTYCQPTTIFWDPDIGILDDSDASITSVSSLMILALTLLSYFASL